MLEVYFLVALVINLISIGYCYITAGKKGYSSVLFAALAVLGGIVAVVAISLMPDKTGNLDNEEDEIDSSSQEPNANAGFMPYKGE